MHSDQAFIRSRIQSIDMMRGLVMLIMLLDHVRERFFYHMQVLDPMDLDETSASLFFSRFAAHLCAPVFVFLTGLSAWLYANPVNGPARSARSFLLKRGLFLIALEVTIINFSWMGSYHTIWLQVIWAIGLSMVVLALVSQWPKAVLALLGFGIVFGHNLLTPVSFQPEEWGYSLWTILHDRNFLVSEGAVKIKASYPVLPWIGVIILGYLAGPLYSKTLSAEHRGRLLLQLGAGCLLLFIVLRGFNIYGETLDWQLYPDLVTSLMSILNLTKYPPSLNYLLVTLGLMFLLLFVLEKPQGNWTQILVNFGSAPMFFYILHLYVLLVLYRIVLAVCGPNQGEGFGMEHMGWIWLTTVLLAVALYLPTKWFSLYKKRSQQAWIRYL
ncbi:DUF1624 domain-containing protein [Rheinheimera tangshanensis]|jgi:uncharacterized membrane protein|uniref:DUF1624 domain-containing protein n=1 Tax=Rheinheimera tangshanensis TaxID=400153 RepID=A0A5C8M438_9GAMM|nr:heparan-alpha-glucosaminide N-acetyltransferase domain-containing protein [Rheinheimera tangshanensis]TXK83225.1 DUF1624 domain-containing protein [Rheinheimera tangshanensis]GGM45296.1 membrane protein [Rheinheimera tangshanensis]